MLEQKRSAEVSKDYFVQAFDKIAEEQKLNPAAQTAIISAVESAKETAIKQAAYVDDKYFYRGVLLILGGSVIVGAIGILILAFYRIDIPQSIVALATTALGAVAGLLAPSPVNQ
ncbi:MAG: hypothetical protein EHM14_15475 [Methanothrix sp.]|nr:MAG: hypothetical protein EHM14_15475 [Methanothrix sp.]